RQYSVVKDLDCLSNQQTRLGLQSADFGHECTRINTNNSCDLCSFFVVGLGGIEPPTSPLSGVRSSHLSYRPGNASLAPVTGGAGRDRTGDLLSANQALSQLSYSP